jgi:tRNA-dihydrouridine synthase B
MRIGAYNLDKPLALAPMEDVTDAAFRGICKELGADLVYTEFASSEALIRDARKTLQKIAVSDAERPVGVQLFGGRESSMEGAAAVAEEMKPDFIDINCGCWVRKVVRREEGAGLLRNPKHFESVVSSVIRGTRLPVTVKTRLGWDGASIVILDVARMLEQLGVAALTVHCRTRDQGHKGEADWSWLAKLKQTVSTPIIGNGDVTCPEDVERMFETGCDGVMIGRAAFHNPWIFQQAKHYLRTKEHLPPVSIADRIDLCIRHLRLSVAHKGTRKGIIDFRKHYAGYLAGFPGAAKLRAELQQHLDEQLIVQRLEDCREQCEAFSMTDRAGALT